MFLIAVLFLSLTIINVNSTLTERIIGGTERNIVDLPYQVSLSRKSTKQHVCSGAIISNRHILTAAHCFNKDYLVKDDFIVFVGRSNLMSLTGMSFLPEKVVLHPLFQGHLDNTYNFLDDIAVIKLTKEIPFNQFQNKINLPTERVESGIIANISGWGISDFKNTLVSDMLQEISMTIFNYRDCLTIFPIKLYLDQICAFKAFGLGPYSGDSGGPVVVDDKLIGIVSISHGKPTHLPHLFTNVYSHLIFIKSVVKH